VSELKASGKPFEISKWEVWEAWEKVKANKGAPGVDGCSIADFESDVKNNLYRIWNRMSSGSYFPPPVLAVEIPKPHGGGTRVAGGAHDRGSGCSNGGSQICGVEGGADLSPGLLRLPAGPVATGCGRGLPAALLEDRPGDRCGHPEILRQRALGPARHRGGGAHRPTMGPAVCDPVAPRADAATRR
jgi:hypothetical protein